MREWLTYMYNFGFSLVSHTFLHRFHLALTSTICRFCPFTIFPYCVKQSTTSYKCLMTLYFMLSNGIPTPSSNTQMLECFLIIIIIIIMNSQHRLNQTNTFCFPQFTHIPELFCLSANRSTDTDRGAQMLY